MEVIEKRLRTAQGEIEEAHHFKYRVVNDDPERAQNEMRRIVGKELGLSCF